MVTCDRRWTSASNRSSITSRCSENEPALLPSVGESGGNRARGVGVRVLGLIFDWYVPLASQSPYTIMVYSVANYRPHLSHF